VKASRAITENNSIVINQVRVDVFLFGDLATLRVFLEAIGTPQFGHAGAAFEISLPHSGQLIKDIILSFIIGTLSGMFPRDLGNESVLQQFFARIFEDILCQKGTTFSSDEDAGCN